MLVALMLISIVFFITGCEKSEKSNSAHQDYHDRKVYVVVSDSKENYLTESHIDSLKSHADEIGYHIEFILPPKVEKTGNTITALLENNRIAVEQDSLTSMIILTDPGYGTYVEAYAAEHVELSQNHFFDDVLLMNAQSDANTCFSYRQELYGAMYLVGAVSALFSKQVLLVPERSGYESAIQGMIDGIKVYDETAGCIVVEMEQFKHYPDSVSAFIKEELTYINPFYVSLSPWMNDSLIHIDNNSDWYLAAMDWSGGAEFERQMINVEHDNGSILRQYITEWLDNRLTHFERYRVIGLDDGFLHVCVMSEYSQCCQELITEMWNSAVQAEKKYMSPYQGTIE